MGRPAGRRRRVAFLSREARINGAAARLFPSCASGVTGIRVASHGPSSRPRSRPKPQTRGRRRGRRASLSRLARHVAGVWRRVFCRGAHGPRGLAGPSSQSERVGGRGVMDSPTRESVLVVEQAAELVCIRHDAPRSPSSPFLRPFAARRGMSAGFPMPNLSGGRCLAVGGGRAASSGRPRSRARFLQALAGSLGSLATPPYLPLCSALSRARLDVGRDVEPAGFQPCTSNSLLGYLPCRVE